MYMKICVVGDVLDVITYAKFQIEIFRGYNFTGGRIFHFSYWFWMGLTTVQRYCAACDNANRSRESLRTTLRNCHVLFRYMHIVRCILYTHRCTGHRATIAQRACSAVRVINRLPYNQSWWCQLERNCDQPTPTTTNVVDVAAYYSASIPSRTRTTMADGHKGFKGFKQHK